MAGSCTWRTPIIQSFMFCRVYMLCIHMHFVLCKLSEFPTTAGAPTCLRARACERPPDINDLCFEIFYSTHTYHRHTMVCHCSIFPNLLPILLFGNPEFNVLFISFPELISLLSPRKIPVYPTLKFPNWLRKIAPTLISQGG